RILPDETVEVTRRRLQEVIGDPAVEVVPEPHFGGSPPVPSDGEGPATLAEVTHRLFPGIPGVPYMSNFTTDSRYLRAARILAYGLSGMALTRQDDPRAPAADERNPVPAAPRAVGMAYAPVP